MSSKRSSVMRPPPVLDTTFDALADAVEAHLDTDRLWQLVRD